MKILFAVPHVFNPSKDGKYGSTGPNPEPRVKAFKSCIAALHHMFGGRHYEIDFVRRQAVPAASQSAYELDIVVLTTRGLHLFDKISFPKGMIRRLDLDVEPMMLEFECQRVLAEALGRYDYYCFLEDDLVIRDSLFIQKLQWFTKRFGDACLLQPNRYELGECDSLVQKLYIDGNVKSTAKYQDVNDKPELLAEILDRNVRFMRPTNPHAASFFLNTNQMKFWIEQPHFLDRDTSLIGPLESAATLGIMRTFRIYKAVPPNREFFEIEHCSTGYLAGVGKEIPISKEPGRSTWWPFGK